MTEELELILVERFTDIPCVQDAHAIHLKDEGGSLHASPIFHIPSLMGGHIIDQNIPEGCVNLVPLESP